MRQLVLQAIGWQIPQDQICQLILHPKTGLPIGETTLKKHFAPEMRRGAANTKVMHAMALWKQVQAGHVTAMIWWDKTRNRIGTSFRGNDSGDEQPDAKPEIEVETDIVVIARRVAFTMAQGAARARAKQAEPPKKPQDKPK